MSITKEQHQALDDALVPREQRLRIGNCNYRLSTTFKPKESTFQVALDVLSLTSFYQAFLISKNIDYVYPLWEDLVFQIKNKEAKNNKDMYYLRFTKVIINHFMSKDQSIPRRNKVDWHMANVDPILTIMRFIPKHKTIKKYSAILPNTLTNQVKKESDAYKTYYDHATGKAIPKPKYVRRSTREKTVQAPKASPSKILKATSKEEILAFMRELGYPRNIKSRSEAEK
nr:hypothetical protein [Tanacetum cinerariifolium]